MCALPVLVGALAAALTTALIALAGTTRPTSPGTPRAGRRRAGDTNRHADRSCQPARPDRLPDRRPARQAAGVGGAGRRGTSTNTSTTATGGPPASGAGPDRRPAHPARGTGAGGGPGYPVTSSPCSSAATSARRTPSRGTPGKPSPTGWLSSAGAAGAGQYRCGRLAAGYAGRLLHHADLAMQPGPPAPECTPTPRICPTSRSAPFRAGVPGAGTCRVPDHYPTRTTTDPPPAPEAAGPRCYLPRRHHPCPRSLSCPTPSRRDRSAMPTKYPPRVAGGRR
jgi:hypothetical protein